PSISRISIARYLGAGFSVKLDGAVNKISKIGDKSVRDKTYYAVDLGANYSFGHLIYNGQGGWFDPYLGVGVGSTWLDGNAEATLNAELGFNFWITDQFGITIGSAIHKAFPNSPNVYSHFQHYIGVKFALGGR